MLSRVLSRSDDMRAVPVREIAQDGRPSTSLPIVAPRDALILRMFTSARLPPTANSYDSDAELIKPKRNFCDPEGRL